MVLSSDDEGGSRGLITAVARDGGIRHQETQQYLSSPSLDGHVTPGRADGTAEGTQKINQIASDVIF